MAKLKRQSTHTHSEQPRARPRLTSDEDAPSGSPVHALHRKLSESVAPSPNIHATPAARILYFVLVPALLWVMIIQAVHIL